MHSLIFPSKAIVALALCSVAWPLARAATSDEAPQSAAGAAVAVAGLGVPLGTSQLEGYRGGFTVVKNDMQLSGAVAGNSAVDVMSGSNYIGTGAFSNASGLPMVIQNSGSNVLIQNATILNVQLN